MTIPDVPRAYDVIAEKFFADRPAVLRERKYLDFVLADLPAVAHVLDLGCGTGRPIAEEVQARGFVVTGVDGSKRMLGIARGNLPKAKLVHARMEEVELMSTFSAAIVWDSLFHVHRDRHAAVYAKLARWIQPGGRLMLSSGGTEGEGFTSQMHGETFFYSSWSPERAVELLERAGFAVELCEMDQPESRGHVAIVALRKTSPHLA